MTPRESLQHEWDVEDFRQQSSHAIKVKEMELAILKEDKQSEIELKKLQAKWASWLQIPLVVITLPVRILFAVAYICSMFTKKEMPRKFWDFMT